MSPGEPNRVLEALGVLCNASVDVLRSHRTELLAAVQRLQSLVEDQSTTLVVAASPPRTNDPGRPSPSFVSHHFSPIPPNINDSLPFTFNSKDPLGSFLGQHPSPHPAHPLPSAPPSSTEQFVEKTNEGLEKIERCLSQICQEGLMSEPMWRNDDPRLIDLQMAGDSKPSTNTKFRRGLSQRSLAIEFADWERKTYGTSILEERATNPLVEPSRKLGHITEFLCANTYRLKNLVAARAGIEHGLKLLVSETLLGGIGYSAILIFRYGKFRAVKYAEFNDLKDAIRKSDSIKRLAVQKAEWFGQCQSIYNAWYKKTIGTNNLQSPPKAGTKRRRLDCSSSRLKRLKAREPHDSSQHMSGASLTAGAEVEALAIPDRQKSATLASTFNIAASSPRQQTQSHHEQNQQSPASCVPSPQHVIHPDPPISSSGCDGANTNSTTGMAMDGTAHQSSSHLVPVSSSRNNSAKEAHGSILSQCLQYNDQHKARSIDGSEGYSPVATVQLSQNTPSRSFPTTAMGTEQLHGFGTELNYTATNTAPNVFNDVWEFSQPLDPKLYNDAWQISQPLDPHLFNDVWPLSQSLDSRLFNDASSEPDPRSF